MLSKRAQALKKTMTAAVIARRAVSAAEDEWRELAQQDDELGEPLIWQLLAEKHALRRQWAALGLRNLARLQHSGLNDRRKRLLRLRYVQGLSWSAVTDAFGCSRQYLMREHNRALELLAAGEKEQRKEATQP